jgi:hypothetical protein
VPCSEFKVSSSSGLIRVVVRGDGNRRCEAKGKKRRCSVKKGLLGPNRWGLAASVHITARLAIIVPQVLSSFAKVTPPNGTALCAKPD